MVWSEYDVWYSEVSSPFAWIPWYACISQVWQLIWHFLMLHFIGMTSAFHRYNIMVSYSSDLLVPEYHLNHQYLGCRNPAFTCHNDLKLSVKSSCSSIWKHGSYLTWNWILASLVFKFETNTMFLLCYGLWPKYIPIVE